MSELTLDTSPPRATRRADERPDIPLPGEDDWLITRRKWAAGVGITDKTASKLKLETTYIGNVAYVRHNKSTLALATHRLRNRCGRR